MPTAFVVRERVPSFRFEFLAAGEPMRARTPPAPVPARKGTTAQTPTPMRVRGLRPRTFRAQAPYLESQRKRSFRCESGRDRRLELGQAEGLDQVCDGTELARLFARRQDA